VSKPRLVEHPLWPAFEAMLRDEPSFSWLRTSAENFTLQLWRVFLAGASAERAACARAARDNTPNVFQAPAGQIVTAAYAQEWAVTTGERIAQAIEARGKPS
jgi:hypothetical protein